MKKKTDWADIAAKIVVGMLVVVCVLGLARCAVDDAVDIYYTVSEAAA